MRIKPQLCKNASYTHTDLDPDNPMEPLTITGFTESEIVKKGRRIISKKKVEVDYTGWGCRRKRDGVLALWDPETQTLYSRGSGQYFPPQWWLDKMPDFPVQGEMTFRNGVDSFPSLSGEVVHRKDKRRETWENIVLSCFDYLADLELPARERFALLDAKITEHLHRVPDAPVEHLELEIVESNEWLLEKANRIIREGWEGLVIYDMDAPYVPSNPARSGYYRRIIGYWREEAVITGYNEGGGKFKGMLGTYSAKFLSDGAKCRVSGRMSDEHRRNPHPIGTIITVEHKGRKNDEYGRARQAQYIGIRNPEDMS